MQNEKEVRKNAVILLAKIRGHKKMSEKQNEDISILVSQTDLSPQEICNEVFNAPSEAMKRRIKRSKALLSNSLSWASDKLKD